MRRREFMTLLGGAAAGWPMAGRAQHSERKQRIGVLMSGAEDDPETQARLVGIRQGLARLGWSEGRNLQIDYRYASASPEKAQAYAKELVTLQPDVILAPSQVVAAVLQRETHVVPIVFVGVADPIGAGLIASLARPGGNLTGTLLNEPSVVEKWLALLKEAAPNLVGVAVLFDPKAGPYRYYRGAADAAARSLALELVPLPIESPAEIERLISPFASTPNGGLLIPPDLTAVLRRHLIIALAAEHRLPAVYQARFWVEAGGLMSYGVDRVAAHRQATYYVDRILRGARPADLPVQAPTKYETVFNLKTAKALDLDVPPTLLVRADEVIE
jgi:putative tryptophan/tyrosine transport system substrate-binding protein